MATQYWLQYHNFDKQGYFPYRTEGFWISTNKECCLDSIGDSVFLIVGCSFEVDFSSKLERLTLGKANKKNYFVWERFVIDKVSRKSEGNGKYSYRVSGQRGKTFNPPILIDSPDWDKFWRSYSRHGFINISDKCCLNTILELTGEKHQISKFSSRQSHPKGNSSVSISLPKRVYEGIEFIRATKSINSLYDFSAVIKWAHQNGYHDTAKWIQNNKEDYVRGLSIRNKFIPLE
jgi:hypothetical protein